jgi:CHAD domain-containing protein
MANELERARKSMRELSKTLKSLLGDPAPREVHKLRTAARRVEAIAAVLARSDEKRSRSLLKSIEPVRKAAGGVRDMDVLTANARRLARRSAGDSLTRLLDHLQIARQQNAEKLRRVLARRRDAAREDLKQYARIVRSALAPAKGAEPSGGQAGQTNEGIHTAAMDAVRELGSWPPLNADNIHAFRLKVKELRYVLQLSADADPGLVDALGNVQRRVGDWHDWQQLEEIAREALDAERDAALLERISQTTKRKFGKALATANALRGRYLAVPFAAGI